MSNSVPTDPTDISVAEPPLDPECEDLPFAQYAAAKLIRDFDFQTLLDVGSGSGKHSRFFASRGKRVTAVDLTRSVYFSPHDSDVQLISNDYMQTHFAVPFDVVWASHILEHQPNPNLFLRKLFDDCKTGGVVAITVPPLKHQIVGGHLTLWNAGLLLYHIVIAGYSCAEASVFTHGYNISVLVRKMPIDRMPLLSQDNGDIDRLASFLPAGCSEGFNGDIDRLNW